MHSNPVSFLVLCPIAALAFLCGCSGALAEGDGRAFGDDLGTFEVVATLESSTCGKRALDAPEEWSFDVILSRKEPTLYWNTGADAVEGDLSVDGERFSFESEVSVNLSEAAAPELACVIRRTDRAEGRLDSPEDTRAFEGTLTYAYSKEGVGDCTMQLLEQNIEDLPCKMTYAMVGTLSGGR
jgi:hypothetical protein